MALLVQDRQTLARMTNALGSRVADKKAARQLQSITNKLTYNNPISPSDRSLLVFAVENLLASPLPPFPVGITAKDYLLVVPAFQKFNKARRLQRQARDIRKSFKDILTRL